MAKQTGPFIFVGTFGCLCFYISRGMALVRVSNPLSSERVKTAPEFAGLRRYAELLKIASPLASAVYKALPQGKKRSDYVIISGLPAGLCCC